MRIRDLFSKIRDLLRKFETYSVLRDYETKKTTGAPAPAAPASLAPMPMLFQKRRVGALGKSPISAKCITYYDFLVKLKKTAVTAQKILYHILTYFICIYFHLWQYVVKCDRE